MRKILGLFTAFALLCFASCSINQELNSSFDIPQDKALATTTDCENAIISAYGAMANTNALGGDMVAWADIISDHVRLRGIVSNPNDLEVYNRNISADNPALANMWKKAYEAINRSNNVIAALESGNVEQSDISGTIQYDSTGQKNRLLGEAYFIRALMHFELTRLFSPQYTSTTASQNFGVPLKLSPTTTWERSSRPTLDQVYNSVITDFKKASQLLALYYPGIGKSYLKIRANKLACYSYLARVYFQKANSQGSNLDSAIYYLENVIGFNTIDQKVFKGVLAQNRENNILYNIFGSGVSNEATESIFYVNNQSTPPNYVLTNVNLSTLQGMQEKYRPIETGAISEPDFGVSSSYISETYSIFTLKSPANVTYAQKRFYKNDKRFLISSGYIRPNILNNRDTLVYKFSYDNAPLNLFRVPELILMRAEINAIKAIRGNLSADIDARNEFVKFIQGSALQSELNTKYGRRTPVLTLVDINNYRLYIDSANAVQFLQLVRQERARELGFEGYRLHEIRRIGAQAILPEDENILMGKGNRTDPSQDLPWNSWRLVLPIPNSEIQLNPLPQNPRSGTY